MPAEAPKIRHGVFPLKQAFKALFADSGVDVKISSYVWAEYVSRGDPYRAFDVYTLEQEHKEQYSEPCDTPEEAHAYIHSWIVRYIAPPTSEIIQLLDQAMVALSMFFEKGSMSDFATRACGQSDRNNAQKFFYHKDNGWRADTDAFREFLSEVRLHLLKLPVRREHGSDSYRMETWDHFKRLMREKIFGQIDSLAKPLDQRQLKDGLTNSVMGTDNLLACLYRKLGGAVHFFTVQNADYRKKFYELFEDGGSNMTCTALLSSELTYHTTPKSSCTWQEASRSLLDLTQKAVSGVGNRVNIKKYLNEMVTFSGYPPAIYKLKEQRIHVQSIDVPIDPNCAGREITDDMKFEPQYSVDRQNLTYIQEWLKMILEKGAAPDVEPIGETIKRLKRESHPKKELSSTEKEKETSSVSTALIFGVGVLLIFIVMT